MAVKAGEQEAPAPQLENGQKQWPGWTLWGKDEAFYLKFKFKLRVSLRAAFLVAVVGIVVLAGTGRLRSMAATRGSVVVFNANWCASCREVLPIVREVAGQNGLTLVEIDVDSQQAPKQARSLGLPIPDDEPPQVFYVDHGRSTLLYNGKQFKYGSGDAVRATVLQNLQRARP